MAKLIKQNLLSLFILLFSPALLFGQSKNDNTVVGKVGDQKITYAELKQNFNSGSDAAATLEELESFLPLYLNYKAKLLAAKDQGYYQDSALVAEHRQYVKQAAYAYWLQKEIKPSAFEEFKKRSEVELKPYHILIAVGQNANEHEVTNAISQLNQAKAEIENGTPLDEVNQKYSTVRNGRSMGGDIPWISAGRTVKEFEDHVFNLEVGEISEPFRTQFGYHIVLLQDKREKTPARLVNHIYVRGTGDSTAYDKIHEAYQKLEQGESWNEVLQQYSEDGASIRNNGRIGWVSYQTNFVMDFVDAVVSLDPKEPYSEPVKTNYGYHIFKIDSVETFKSEQAKREALMKQLEDTRYYQENNQSVVNYLKDKFNAEPEFENVAKYKEWFTAFDSTLIAGIPSPTQISSNKVYEFDGKKFTVGNFHEYIKSNHGTRIAKQFRDSWFEDFTKYVVDSEIIDLTLENFPEFEQQSESYINGLVVYNINEEKLWSAATVDSSRLRSIYAANPEKYSHPERPFYYLITARDDSTLDKAVTFVQSGGSPDSLRARISRLAVSSDSTSGFTHEPFNRMEGMNEKSFSEKFNYNNRRAIFWLEDRLPPRRMTFEEAFNRLLSEFQPQREQEWLEELQKKYKVKADYKNLKKAFQKDS